MKHSSLSSPRRRRRFYAQFAFFSCLLPTRPKDSNARFSLSLYLRACSASFTLPSLYTIQLCFRRPYTTYCSIVFGFPSGSGLLRRFSALRSTFGLRRFKPGGALDSFTKSGFVLDGLCFSTSLSFLTIELGKIAHDQEMRTFFTQSGFPIWFMYAVMSVEILASLGLFFRATVVGSASFLFLIMCGAIFTHCQNRDPLSDSIDALHILILLVCIVLLHLIDSPPPFDPFRSRT